MDLRTMRTTCFQPTGIYSLDSPEMRYLATRLIWGSKLRVCSRGMHSLGSPALNARARSEEEERCSIACPRQEALRQHGLAIPALRGKRPFMQVVRDVSGFIFSTAVQGPQPSRSKQYTIFQQTSIVCSVVFRKRLRNLVSCLFAATASLPYQCWLHPSFGLLCAKPLGLGISKSTTNSRWKLDHRQTAKDLTYKRHQAIILDYQKVLAGVCHVSMRNT